MQTIRAKSLKGARGFNLLLLLELCRVHGGKLTTTFTYLFRESPTNYITGWFRCRHATFILYMYLNV